MTLPVSPGKDGVFTEGPAGWLWPQEGCAALREAARPGLLTPSGLDGSISAAFLEYWGFPNLCPRTGVTSYSPGNGKLHMTGSRNRPPGPGSGWEEEGSLQGVGLPLGSGSPRESDRREKWLRSQAAVGVSEAAVSPW